MSVKAKIAAGAATLTLVGGGLGMVGTLTASASTPTCGAYTAGTAPTQPIFGFGGSTGTPSTGCAQIFSQKYGPQYLLDVYQTSAKAGQPIILFQRSNTDQAEDFAVEDFGSVSDFYHHYGLVSSAFAHSFGADTAYEIQYEPYGLNSNFCVSTWPGSAPQVGYKAQLEYCGQYSNSLWAADTPGAAGSGIFGGGATAGSGTATDHRSSGAVFSPAGTDVALINGADNSFSNPLVLNYPAGNPTDMPRPQLTVQPENTYSTTGTAAGNTVFDNQEWGTVAGIVTH
jgi:hypothetical protein